MEEKEESQVEPQVEEEEEEIIESDLELEGDTVDPDNDPPQKVLLYFYFFKTTVVRYVLVAFQFFFYLDDGLDCLQMGDPSVEVTDECRDASQEAKAKAMEALSQGMVYKRPSAHMH